MLLAQLNRANVHRMSREISKTEVPEVIGEYEGVILRSKLTLDKSILDKAHKLQFIARAGAGLDKIDVEDESPKLAPSRKSLVSGGKKLIIKGLKN